MKMEMPTDARITYQASAMSAKALQHRRMSKAGYGRLDCVQSGSCAHCGPLTEHCWLTEAPRAGRASSVGGWTDTSSKKALTELNSSARESPGQSDDEEQNIEVKTAGDIHGMQRLKTVLVRNVGWHRGTFIL